MKYRCLTADLFERVPDQRGTPARCRRRELVNACSYVLHGGALGDFYQRHTPLASGLLGVFTLGGCWCIRENAGPVTQAVAFPHGTRERADRGDYRCPVQWHFAAGRRERFRCRENGQWPSATSSLIRRTAHRADSDDRKFAGPGFRCCRGCASVHVGAPGDVQ